MYPEQTNETYQPPAPLKGTTGVALVFDDGVVVAADKRASADYMIASPTVQKVHMLTTNIGMAIAGLVSDALSLVDIMRAELKLYSLENGYEPTVKVAASLLTTIIHNGYRSNQPWWVQLLVVGVDVEGAHVYDIDPSGASLKDNYSVIGSGTPYAIAILDYKFKKAMKHDEAVKLAEDALHAALSRDLPTGDGLDIFVIERNKKVEKIFRPIRKETYRI